MPLQCLCQRMLTIERGNPLLTKPTKPPKTNKKEPKIERGNPLCSDILEWLQKIRENLVDDEVPERGDSHASSSHEVSSEPTFKRREDLGKHSVCTHFPEDRNCEICQRKDFLSRQPRSADCFVFVVLVFCRVGFFVHSARCRRDGRSHLCSMDGFRL